MIKLIQGNEAHQYPGLIAQMFRLRARAFRDRLDWDVKVVDGEERDRFDECDPLYVLALDSAGDVVGSARLLQTTGPNMLADVFPQLLPQGTTIRSPLVWESTRFCVDTDVAATHSATGLSPASGEIMASEIEIGLQAGLSHIVTVVDVRMERILRRSCCGFERLAPPVRIGKVLSVAGLIAVNSEVLADIRAAHKVETQTYSKAEQSVSVAA
jgi:acyl homoserine lactone synthase